MYSFKTDACIFLHVYIVAPDSSGVGERAEAAGISINMEVPSLKHIAKSTVLQCVVREDSPSVNSDIQWMHLIKQLDEGSWGLESKLILDRAVKYFGHKLTPKIVEALLPSATKELCLKECPKVTEQCIDMILNRCRNLHSLDLTENPHLEFEKSQLFRMENKMVHTGLTSVILEDCPQVSDEHVQALLKNAPSLQTLNIARCDITDKVFLLNETKQLAREGLFQLPPLTDGYDSALRNVDVSRNKNFTSTGVRHLCTLCGPTLSSVNLAWTMVDCTVLVYLSGYGLPAVLQFYLSFNFLKDPMIDALVRTLHEFDKISELINDHCKSGNVTESKDTSGEDETIVQSSKDSEADDLAKEFEEKINLCPNDSVFSKVDPVDNNNSVNISGPSAVDSNASVESQILVRDGSSSSIQGASPSPTIKASDCKQVCGSENQGLIYPETKSTLNSGVSSERSELGQVFSSQVCSSKTDAFVSADTVVDKMTFENLSDDSQQRTDNHRIPESQCSQSERFLKHCEPHHYPLTENCRDENLPTTDSSISSKLFESLQTKAAKMQPFFTSNITSLSIQGMIFKDQNLGLTCFEKFLTSNKNLSAIKLFGGITGNYVQDGALKLIGEHGINLMSIGLEGCDHVTDVGVTSLVACKKLTEVDLTGVAFIEDAGILLLAHSLPLSKMLLAETKITSIALNTIASRPVAETLKDLDLSWCEEMDNDDGLNNAVTKCTSLERLMLRECHLSPYTMELIAKNCHLITQLSIASNMPTVLDDSVILLSENLPLLEIIDLGWDTELTNRSITALLTNCRKLQIANLEGLKLITSEPFVNIIAIPDALSQYIDSCMTEYGHTGGLWTKLSELPCLPIRSTVYCTELNLLHLKYSDYVEDECMQEVVAFSQGSLKVIDYYGEYLPELETAMERFIQRLISERWEKEEERRKESDTEF